MPSTQPGFHDQDCVGETVLSCKQLISRAGFARFLSTSSDPTYFEYLPAWSTLPDDTSQDNPYIDMPVTYSSYFSTAYAYARGSTRYSSVAFTPDAFQEVCLSDDPRSGVPGLFSAAGYLTERGTLHFTVPFYSNKSRVRVQAYLPGICKMGVRGADPMVAARLSVSAGDDAQLGYFLGAPPLLYRADGLGQRGPFYDWSPQQTFTNNVASTSPLQTETLVKVHDAYGNPVVVTTDTQDSFTVLHSGQMTWNGSSWIRAPPVSSPANPLPVTVSNTVAVSIPDNLPVLIKGLDESSMPQFYAARQGADGNHTLPSTIYANSRMTGTPAPINAYAGGDTIFSLYTKENSS